MEYLYFSIKSNLTLNLFHFFFCWGIFNFTDFKINMKFWKFRRFIIGTIAPVLITVVKLYFKIIGKWSFIPFPFSKTLKYSFERFWPHIILLIATERSKKWFDVNHKLTYFHFLITSFRQNQSKMIKACKLQASSDSLITLIMHDDKWEWSNYACVKFW